MGTSYIKMFFREFKSSIGRFAAIFGIVALGVGLLSGLLVTTPNMHESVDDYYDSNNTADIFIKATMGLTEDDLDKVEKNEHVKEIMPAFAIDKLLDLNKKEVIAAKIYGLPLLDAEDEVVVNKLDLLEGRMPENNRECLVERKSPYIKGIKIGSNLKISKDNEDYEDTEDIYDVEEYTVVGIVGNSFHFSQERESTNIGSGKLDTIIYVDKTSYALEEFTDFYITLEDAMEMNSFSSKYKDYTENVVEELEDLGEKRSKARKREVLDEAQEELDKGFEEYEEEKEKAYRELSKALDEINEGREELQTASQDIEEAQKEIEDAKKTLKKENKEALREINKGERELEDARLTLVESEEELQAAKSELEDGEEQYKEGYREYREGKEQLGEGKTELLKGKKEFKKQEKEFLKGKQELESGKIELTRAKRELERGQSQYESGMSELQAGKSKFLTSLAPLAKEIGYPSAEKLISTPNGQSALKYFLAESRQQISQGLAEARAGKDQVENGIEEIKKGKPELEEGIKQLKLKLQWLMQDPDGNKEEIIATKTQIKELEKQLAQANEKLLQLQNQLKELETTITDLEKQQAELPDYDFLIQNWNEIEENERQLKKAKEELDEGHREYNEGIRELEASENTLDQAETQIEEGRKELEKNEKQIESIEKELDKALKTLEASKKDLESGREEYQSGLKEIEEGWKEYESGIAELKVARSTLKNEMEDANEEIKYAEKELKKGIKQYEEGIEEIEQAEIDYQNAKEEVKEELDDAYDELLEAEEEIKDLDDPKWYVLDRDSNISYVSFELNADKVDAISKVFPIFFYLVAGLVALTTMTRMVEEERTQIGTLKALGYKKTVIISKYILYCGLASIFGSIMGQIVGFEVIPRVIWNAFGVMYHLPPFIIDYNKEIALVSSGVAVISTVAATFFAASGALREKPSLLMLPRPPKKGKRILLERITPLWSAMSFNLKSTARNIFRYKKHFYMTVIGVSGCTALLVAGFGLRDSINDVGDIQFEELFNYQLRVQLEEDYDLNNLDKIGLDHEEIKDILQIFSDKGKLEFKGKNEDITLIGVDDTEDTSNYVTFKNRESGEAIDFTDDKIIVTEKITEELDISVGDTVLYENSDGEEREFKVDGITENYIGNYIYMDKTRYESEFNGRHPNNTIYAKTENLDSQGKDNLIEKLYQNKSILSAEFVSQTRGIFDNLIESINYIVIVIIIASGLLAFIVLYNLTNININERRRELATLKVLGFYREEVASYIFREITILALIGTFVGLVLGKYLHQFIIITIEDPGFMFGRDAKILSYILSAVITMIFSVIVDLFMVKKLKNIKMVDSMKAND